MGRKGIGKLSAFGVAARMIIRSKRKGQPFWTELDLESAKLMVTEDITTVPIPHRYVDAKAKEVELQGTTIILSGLRCDSMNFTSDELEDILNETFYPIKPAEFDIRINGKAISRKHPPLEFWFPEDIKKNEMAQETLADPA